MVLGISEQVYHHQQEATGTERVQIVEVVITLPLLITLCVKHQTTLTQICIRIKDMLFSQPQTHSRYNFL